MKKLLTIVLILLSLNACRTVKNVTETDKQTETVQQLKTDTKTISNKVTEIKIPASVFKSLAIQYKEASVDTNGGDKVRQKQNVATTEDSNDVITITTSESSVTTTETDEKVTQTIDEETKEVEKKDGWSLNLNYLWLILGISIIVIVTLKYIIDKKFF